MILRYVYFLVISHVAHLSHVKFYKLQFLYFQHFAKTMPILYVVKCKMKLYIFLSSMHKYRKHKLFYDNL